MAQHVDPAVFWGLTQVTVLRGNRTPHLLVTVLPPHHSSNCNRYATVALIVTTLTFRFHTRILINILKILHQLLLITNTLLQIKNLNQLL